MKETIAGMDPERLREVMHEVGIVRTYRSVEQLQEYKDRLVQENSKFEEVTLGQIQDFLDLGNSIFEAVYQYHVRYDGKVLPKKTEPEIPEHNKAWHKENKLKAYESLDEKVKRHIDHVAHCRCGYIPRYIKKEIDRRMGAIN